MIISSEGKKGKKTLFSESIGVWRHECHWWSQTHILPEDAIHSFMMITKTTIHSTRVTVGRRYSWHRLHRRRPFRCLFRCPRLSFSWKRETTFPVQYQALRGYFFVTLVGKKKEISRRVSFSIYSFGFVSQLDMPSSSLVIWSLSFILWTGWCVSASAISWFLCFRFSRRQYCPVKLVSFRPHYFSCHDLSCLFMLLSSCTASLSDSILVVEDKENEMWVQEGEVTQEEQCQETSRHEGEKRLLFSLSIRSNAFFERLSSWVSFQILMEEKKLPQLPLLLFFFDHRHLIFLFPSSSTCNIRDTNDSHHRLMPWRPLLRHSLKSLDGEIRRL